MVELLIIWFDTLFPLLKQPVLRSISITKAVQLSLLRLPLLQCQHSHISLLPQKI